MPEMRITGYRQHQRRRSTYVALAGIDDDGFIWDLHSEVRVFDQMWEEGAPFWEICERLNRKPDHVLILIIDRAMKGAIKPRPGGVFGNEWKKARQEK